MRIWLAVLVWTATGAAGARAQEPDTIPADTVVVPIPPEAVASDTLPADTLMGERPDSLKPAPELPPFPDPLPSGWAFGRLELSRDELLRYRGLSLLDLLERVPGIVSVRAGGFGRPAGLSALGLGGGRVRVFLDGYELDPLGSPTHELQQIGLIGLEAVRVERDAAGVRVELTSFRLPDARPYSEIELAAGNYDTRLLRATLARVAGERNVVAASYELVTTDGVGIAEPFQFNGARLSWSRRPTPTTGLKLELHQASAERGGQFFPAQGSRLDLILRGRAEPRPNVTVEGLLGRSRWSLEGGEPSPGGGAGVDTIFPRFARSQALLRAAWTAPAAALEGSARLRSSGDPGAPAPTLELAARGSSTPVPWGTLASEVSIASVDGLQASHLQTTARVGPFAGLSAFTAVGLGTRWIVPARDTVFVVRDTIGVDTVGGQPVPRVQDRTVLQPLFSTALASAAGIRAGAEWRRRGLLIGAAVTSLAPGSVAPFGLGFDRGVPPVEAASARGVEAHALLPIPGTRGDLRLEGSGSVWGETGGRPYLPEREARVALEFHTLRIEGQFEPTLRLEAVHRGRTLVPTADGREVGVFTPPYTILNFFMQIRVLDVRAFLFWENIAHNRLAIDLAPGVGFQPGQRVVYGGRWFFRN